MSDWQPIETAPQDGTVIRCKNSCMDFTVLSMEWIVVLDEDDWASIRPGSFFVPTIWQYVSDPEK